MLQSFVILLDKLEEDVYLYNSIGYLGWKYWR